MSGARAYRDLGDPPASDSRGFVLIGVVIFVLALTILGLSLFSLSSYEAQFLWRSHRDTQTLYAATSGIEWAKTILSSERKLQAIRSGQLAWSTRPPEVTLVQAWQGTDSTGSIDFTNGEPVRIRALADDQRGERRMVEKEYWPVVPDALYRHLIDSYSFVYLKSTKAGDTLRTQLDGEIRLNTNTYPSWQTEAWPPLPPAPILGGVPLPDVTSFINAHPTSNEIGYTGSGVYDLVGSGDVTFFLTPTPETEQVSLYDHSGPPYDTPVDINVTGTCVWMLPKGIRIDRPVQVFGTASDRLVIVAGPIGNGSPPPPFDKKETTYVEGIWLFSGIRSDYVPVVLVSDAQVVISRGQITTWPGTAEALSLFARSVYLEGPSGGPVEAPNVQVLRHPVDMDAVIDELAEKGALPNLTGGSESAFTPIPGTWRELDPDNPS